MFYYLNKTCRFFSGCFHLPVPATIVLTADTFLHAVTTYQHLVIFLMHFSGDVHLSVPVTTALILEKSLSSGYPHVPAFDSPEGVVVSP
jgi:hypothetical protein